MDNTETYLLLQPHGRVEFYDTLRTVDIINIDYDNNSICISNRKRKESDSIIQLLGSVWANLQIVYNGKVKYKAAVLIDGQAQSFPSNAKILARNKASGFSIFEDNCILFHFDQQQNPQTLNQKSNSLKEIFK